MKVAIEEKTKLRPDLDGLLMKLPGNDALYLMDQGMKRHIPNTDTFHNLFVESWKREDDAHLDEITTGVPLSNGAILARANGADAVYLIDHGCKRWIFTPEAFKRYQFEAAKIKSVPSIMLDFIPDGPRIQWPE